LHDSLLHLLLEHCNFLNIDISQGSVATRLLCCGIFKYDFVTNLPLYLTVKEIRKSVNVWRSYGQEYSVLFFSDSQCRNEASFHGSSNPYLQNYNVPPCSLFSCAHLTDCGVLQ